jgi:hypothetical protein
MMNPDLVWVVGGVLGVGGFVGIVAVVLFMPWILSSVYDRIPQPGTPESAAAGNERERIRLGVLSCEKVIDADGDWLVYVRDVMNVLYGDE